MILHGIEYQRPTSLNMRILADHVTYSFLAFMKSIFHFCLGCYCGGYSQNGRSNLSSCIWMYALQHTIKARLVKLHLPGTQQATPQNSKIGIQQERLHGAACARSRRATAVSPGITRRQFNFQTKLPCDTCCCEQFSLLDTDPRKCWYMVYVHESRTTAACYM